MIAEEEIIAILGKLAAHAERIADNESEPEATRTIAASNAHFYRDMLSSFLPSPLQRHVEKRFSSSNGGQ